MEDDEYSIDLSSIEDLTVSISVPNSPNVGDLWIDTTTMNTNIYSDNRSWITITSNDIDLNNITYDRVMFEDDMPDPQELKRMCEEYPALEKAYENFKTVYKMVHQDWRGKQDAENGSLF